ncbi:MAG TPA: RNA-binding S4 domain-containing protein [Azospirillaceae bacterium]|nr:RNA-binding S4 domain-containing protein [Azospirillaceae bacterium]
MTALRHTRAPADQGGSGGTEAVGRLRLDKWLWHARFLKTRSQATRFCAETRIRSGGSAELKPSHPVKPGDVLTFTLGRHVRVIRVTALGTRRGPPAEARALYEDLSPPSPDTALPRGGVPIGVVEVAGDTQQGPATLDGAVGEGTVHRRAQAAIDLEGDGFQAPDQK